MILQVNPSSSSFAGTVDGENDRSFADASPNAAPNRAGVAGGESITVILAEDRANIREAFGAYFPPQDGIKVVGQAADCRQVLGLVENLRPDVVVIAMRMALRIGIETIRRLLKTRWGSELLILLPNRECPFVQHVAVAGASGYLTEQDSSQVMAARIRQVRAGSKGGFSPRVKSEIANVKESTRLTPREQETLKMIAEGCTNKAIASEMAISIKTVEKHRQHLMDKLAIHETATLTRYALYVGLVH